MNTSFVCTLSIYERRVLKSFIIDNLDHDYKNCDVADGKFICPEDEDSYNFLDRLANSL